ncbi:MAG: heme ABC exporter ATP-binding protein CcmA [Chloroflexi bacterium]|nr:heme ABC exporter ATP-binding protein CcmA [Chloroflexota bacterium]
MEPASAAPRPTFGMTATGLTKLYGETVALWHVDLRVASRELVAVHGPNASGKSTLLRIIAGLTAATHGQVTWATEAGVSRRRLAFVGHAGHLYDALTPVENLQLAARLARADTGDLVDVLGRLGLAAVAATPCRDLSAGMARRVAIGRAIATDPDVLLVDEPFAAQDQAAGALVATLLADLAHEGRLVIIASHDDARSRSVASRNVFLEAGHVAAGADRRQTIGAAQ